jgi:heavy metal translocating P-type ATPase
VAEAGPRRASAVIPALALLGIVAGGVAWWLGAPEWARFVWAASIVICLVPLTFSIVAGLWRGKAGVDLIALLAMAGSLAVGEELAGAVVALMLAGGQELEAFAGRRARRELKALAERAPRIAHRIEEAGVVDLPLREVRPGDLLLVRTGEVLPVDGTVVGATALLDESALTGEAMPVERLAGDLARSGTVNAGTPFQLLAIATAEASTYAGILRLVENAEREKAPMTRLADRYAVAFLPFTLALAAAAYFYSGDPRRAIAVLVVATPCPLILAAPVAIVAGLSRAARAGVIVKGGEALETLARAEILLLDKTGTVTLGEPRLVGIELAGVLGEDELLRLAGSLETASSHVLGPAIVRAARDRGLRLSLPREVEETSGEGLRGLVDGHEVRIGKLGWALPGIPPPAGAAAGHASSAPWVVVDGAAAGSLVLADVIRPEAKATLAALRVAGIKEIILLTGDRAEVAAEVGASAGVDRVVAEASPAGKVQTIAAAGLRGVTVMVGDGINDAPALAAAGVGVAMGARGASAASEAADLVIVADRLDLLAVARGIATRSFRIATQSVVAGMALSALGMAAAAAGWLPPVAGAIAQEGIDLAVILNALRALRD